MPIPPLAEQLEASLTSGEATRARLLDALLHDALSSPTTIAA